jgi:hypothetical protein
MCSSVICNVATTSILFSALVAHWPLDKASGMTDTSGNNFHFVPSSSFSPVTYTTDENGATDGATVFNTLAVPVTSPDMSALIHPLASFTITAWVRHQSSSSDGYPFRLVDNGGNMLFHIKTASTSLYFAGKNYDNKAYNFPVNTWYYLAIKFDGATLRPRVWVNGVDLSFPGTVHTLSGGSWIMGNGARVIVGQARMGSTASFNAAISNVRFYDSVVAGAEQPGYLPPTPAPPPPPTTIAPTTQPPTTELPTTEATDGRHILFVSRLYRSSKYKPANPHAHSPEVCILRGRFM